MSASVILHLGLGAFHRAHQAMALQHLQALGSRTWTSLAGNIRDDAPALMAALARQSGAYTLETVAPDGAREYQRIESIQRVLAPEELVAAGADPHTRIVSFTVTEAGYAFDAQGQLALTHPDVARDLAQERIGRAGSTLYGVLVALLRARRATGAGPVTLLCCDNLRHGGDRSRAGLLRFIEAAGDAGLADWVRANTSSPNAMVDRITPRPDAGLPARVREATGRYDAAPVSSERYWQWVIEDRFIAGRPDWERVGVQLVKDVGPYEEAKIRILNAGHSGLAWLGTLAGLRFIHEAARDQAIRRAVRAFITDDVIPGLEADGAGPIDLQAYRDTVLDRFGNVALGDTLERVASDSFAKVPGFFAPTPRARLAAGEIPHASAALAAAFLAFLKLWATGALPAHRDQAMNPKVARAMCSNSDPVAAFCGYGPLWGEIAGDARWTNAVRSALGNLPR